MGKKKLSKEQKGEVAMKRNLAPIWKEFDECMAELRAKEEAERLKKEAEEVRDGRKDKGEQGRSRSPDRRAG